MHSTDSSGSLWPLGRRSVQQDLGTQPAVDGGVGLGTTSNGLAPWPLPNCELMRTSLGAATGPVCRSSLTRAAGDSACLDASGLCRCCVVPSRASPDSDPIAARACPPMHRGSQCGGRAIGQLRVIQFFASKLTCAGPRPVPFSRSAPCFVPAFFLAPRARPRAVGASA